MEDPTETTAQPAPENSAPAALPTISKKEVAWHQAQAGAAARAEAAAKGADPAVVRAVMGDANTIAGIPFRPVGVDTILCLSEIGSPFAIGGNITLFTLAEAAFVFSDPQEAWDVYKTADDDEWKRRIMRFAANLNPTAIKQITAFIESEIDAFRGDPDESEANAGKSPRRKGTVG